MPLSPPPAFPTRNFLLDTHLPTVITNQDWSPICVKAYINSAWCILCGVKLLCYTVAWTGLWRSHKFDCWYLVQENEQDQARHSHQQHTHTVNLNCLLFYNSFCSCGHWNEHTMHIHQTYTQHLILVQIFQDCRQVCSHHSCSQGCSLTGMQIIFSTSHQG